MKFSELKVGTAFKPTTGDHAGKLLRKDNDYYTRQNAQGLDNETFEPMVNYWLHIKPQDEVEVVEIPNKIPAVHITNLGSVEFLCLSGDYIPIEDIARINTSPASSHIELVSGLTVVLGIEEMGRVLKILTENYTQ